jgi:hypothetical protein
MARTLLKKSPWPGSVGTKETGYLIYWIPCPEAIESIAAAKPFSDFLHEKKYMS